MSNRINFITCDNVNGGGSRIRLYNVVKYLTEEGVDVNINGNIFKHDINIFRKSIPRRKLILRFLLSKILRKVTVFDIDDYIPKFFPFVKLADIVVVSTEYLCSRLKRYNRNVFIIENSLDIDDYDVEYKIIYNESKKVCWYGNNDNSYILKKWGIQSVDVISEKGDVKWEKETIDKTLLSYDLVIIPQEENVITLSKTHCRLLKALYLGIPVLVSNMPEYTRLLILLHIDDKYVVYDKNDWNKKIEDVKANYENYKLHDIFILRKKILDSYSVYVIGHQWINLFETIITGNM
jgi:hypothetical protein